MPRYPNMTTCGAKTRAGGLCQSPPCKGGKRCRMHGGAAPQTKRKAGQRIAEDKARRALETYGQRIDTDPITAILDEVCWTAGHVAWLRERVQEVEQAALVWGVTERVNKGATEFEGIDVTEAAVPNIWLTLYQKERQHLLAACKTAHSMGIEEARVRLAERQGDMIVQVLQKIFGDLQLSPDQAALVPQVVPARLREMSELALAA